MKRRAPRPPMDLDLLSSQASKRMRKADELRVTYDIGAQGQRVDMFEGEDRVFQQQPLHDARMKSAALFHLSPGGKPRPTCDLRATPARFDLVDQADRDAAVQGGLRKARLEDRASGCAIGVARKPSTETRSRRSHSFDTTATATPSTAAVRNGCGETPGRRSRLRSVLEGIASSVDSFAVHSTAIMMRSGEILEFEGVHFAEPRFKLRTPTESTPSTSRSPSQDTRSPRTSTVD